MQVQREDRRETILVVDSEVLVRHELAEYLRRCGYRVVEASTTDEALLVLSSSGARIDAVLCDAGAGGGASVFALANRLRAERPDLQILVAGGPERAAQAAGELCEDGPELKRPYEPAVIVDRIRRSLAARARSRGE